MITDVVAQYMVLKYAWLMPLGWVLFILQTMALLWVLGQTLSIRVVYPEPRP